MLCVTPKSHQGPAHIHHLAGHRPPVQLRSAGSSSNPLLGSTDRGASTAAASSKPSACDGSALRSPVISYASYTSSLYLQT